MKATSLSLITLATSGKMIHGLNAPCPPKPLDTTCLSDLAELTTHGFEPRSDRTTEPCQRRDHRDANILKFVSDYDPYFEPELGMVPKKEPQLLLNGRILVPPSSHSQTHQDPRFYCPLPTVHQDQNLKTLNYEMKKEALARLSDCVNSIAQSMKLTVDTNPRIKTSKSALGKLLTEALSINRNAQDAINDKEEALDLIQRHHGLINCLAKRKDQFGNPLTPNFLSDLMGLRIIVDSDNPQDCFLLLNALQEKLSEHSNQEIQFSINPDSSNFKNYIQNPKPNGYQSLHISVTSSTKGVDFPIEVQLRTKSMHHHAVNGPAAHGDYKKIQELLVTAFFEYFENQSF